MPRAETLEALLLSQLKDVQKQMAQLQSERDALLRQLEKVRASNTSLRDVTRKNSYTRILTENRVLEVLRASIRPTPTKVLVKEVKGIHPDMKDVTARSHLARMRDKGLISSAGHGLWKAVAQVEDDDLPF